MASLSGLKISWTAVSPARIIHAAALYKWRMVCRRQKMRFHRPSQPWRGEGGREHCSPLPQPPALWGPAAAATITDRKLLPGFFPCNRVVSLGTGRVVLLPRSPARWRTHLPNLCWGTGEGGQGALATARRGPGGQQCVRGRTGHTQPTGSSPGAGLKPTLGFGSEISSAL